MCVVRALLRVRPFGAHVRFPTETSHFTPSLEGCVLSEGALAPEREVGVTHRPLHRILLALQLYPARKALAFRAT